MGRLVAAVAINTYRELVDATAASLNDNLGGHLRARAVATGRTADKWVTDAATGLGDLVAGLKEEPMTAAPRLLVLVITSLIVSGGPDGDGGAPDLDITYLGIGAHRSPFTHSILMGATLETGLLALVRLVMCVHKNLPVQHDPLWDLLQRHSIELIDAASKGISAGLAYHFMIDGVVQPSAYHDIPVVMPIEAHQVVIVINSVAEAIDIGQKPQVHCETSTAVPNNSQSSKVSRKADVDEFDLIAPADGFYVSSLLVQRHAQLSVQHWEVPKALATWLQDSEIEQLRVRRNRMALLASGRLPPLNATHARFVRVAKREAVALSMPELAWIALGEAAGLDWADKVRTKTAQRHPELSPL